MSLNSKLKVGGVGSHFRKFAATPTDKEWIVSAIEDLFTHTLTNFDRQIFRPILCIGNIMGKVSVLLSNVDSITVPEIISEAELRFAIADPAIEM